MRLLFALPYNFSSLLSVNCAMMPQSHWKDPPCCVVCFIWVSCNIVWGQQLASTHSTSTTPAMGSVDTGSSLSRLFVSVELHRPIRPETWTCDALTLPREGCDLIPEFNKILWFGQLENGAWKMNVKCMYLTTQQGGFGRPRQDAKKVPREGSEGRFPGKGGKVPVRFWGGKGKLWSLSPTYFSCSRGYHLSLFITWFSWVWCGYVWLTGKISSLFAWNRALARNFVGECVIASGCWVELGLHFQGPIRSNYEDDEL